jgi:predicted esterase
MKNSLAVLLLWSASLQDPAACSASPELRDVQFTQTAPYSGETNLTRHFGYTVPWPSYVITNESFQIVIPESYSTNGSWGLLVWISPSDDPAIPEDWQAELVKHQLLFVSAHGSGNQRHPADRFRLALDATCNMCGRHAVNRRRIYIGGFSGGSRIASMLGVAYADVFTGALCVSGVNFYKDLIATGGQYYPATFTPDPGILLQGKRSGRFVLLTGEHDQNRENTQRVSASGFKREGFRNVLYLEVPGMSHAMPTAAVLSTALDYLAGEPEKATTK